MKEVYTLLKKNKNSLKSLIKNILNRNKFLSDKGYHYENGDNRFKWVIIDDEADNASIDTTSMNDKKKRSAINKQITEIISLLHNSCYVAYTATPFANLFIPKDERLDLDPNFIQYIKPGTNYKGYEHYFLTETPKGEKNYQHKKTMFNWKNAETPEEKKKLLSDALWSFMIDSAFKSKTTKKFRMIINVAHKKNDHSDIKKILEEILREIQIERSKNNNYINKKIVDVLVKYFGYTSEEALQKMISLRNKYYIQEEIMKPLSGNRNIFVQNSNEDTEIDIKSPKIAILVGGYRFGRGLTLSDFTFAYIDRTTTQYDTLLQQARFFGYRKTMPTIMSSNEYIDRLFLVSTASEALINAILSASHDMTVKKFRASIFKFENMLPTSRNKIGKNNFVMTDPKYWKGTRQNYNKLHITNVEHNHNHITQFIESLCNSEKSLNNNSRVFVDIPAKDVIQLLENIKLEKLSPEIIDQFRKATNSGTEKFNILVPSGDSNMKNTINIKGVELNKQSSKRNQFVNSNDKFIWTASTGKKTDYESDYKRDSSFKRKKSQNNLIVFYNPELNSDPDMKETVDKALFISIEFSSNDDHNVKFDRKEQRLAYAANNEQIILGE